MGYLQSVLDVMKLWVEETSSAYEPLEIKVLKIQMLSNIRGGKEIGSCKIFYWWRVKHGEDGKDGVISML